MADTDSLGLYAHVPFCRHACPYCDFYKIELRDRRARERLEFPGWLEREHRLLLEAHPELATRPLESVYLGGGTPSTLSPAGVSQLLETIAARHPASHPEVTLEANPENLTFARCLAWKTAGVTRLSIGAQSFLQRDLDRLERLHAAETIPHALENARKVGFDNASIDLMFGLPDQTIDEWMDNLAAALALEPEHISFYGLTIHEETPFFVQHRSGTLIPSIEEDYARMYLEGARFLEQAGFEHYEISNFAKPGFQSLHNRRYWRARDVTGIGPGAHSSVGGLRWLNPDDIDSWKAALAGDNLPRTLPERLDRAEELEEELFRLMRTREGFDRTSGRISDEVFFAWLSRPAGQEALGRGWVRVSGNAAWLTAEGWLVSDSILLAAVAENPLVRRGSPRKGAPSQEEGSASHG